jgi:hypothetical protein
MSSLTPVPDRRDAEAGGTESRRDLEREREIAQAAGRKLGDDPRLSQVLYWLGRIDYVRATRSAVDLRRRSLEVAERLAMTPSQRHPHLLSRSSLSGAVP